ncbi:MAG: hypothetical protein ONB48_16275 [candidate division KSB1 bacterium]|nr:hypothetical protein [candidate division KSB1 bacterium]MDZ7274272.1 hypothetical protein [candidate division KSB1 bacterium]MDZ7287206.1 hypothetical protein [candidate division KSB1 bacterium]MDZ7296869.1 hypothetical protein [candidate division KSB1 bacterium]MDZ7306026.1 hypothetical protein [candidate division KSB1 bacterium]
MLLRYTLAWFLLMIAAIGNGAIREAVYKNRLGDLHAHQLSTLTGIVLFGVIVWALSRIWPLASTKQAWTAGFLWLSLTIAFEFLFGHFVAGHPWHRLLQDYNIFAGRVWPLVLIWVTIAPWVFYKLR